MQIELVDVQRRVQSRVPLPWIQFEPQWLAAQQQSGRPAVRFSDIPLEWSDFRLSLRQTADILKRHDAIEPLSVPVVEVHLSNIDERDDWRRQSVIADLVAKRFIGHGPDGYRMALEFLKEQQ